MISKKAIKDLKNDTNKVLCYLKFAKMLEPFSGDTVLAITKRAKDLSVKLNYQRGIALSIYGEGLRAEYLLDYPSAIRYYKEAIKIAEAGVGQVASLSHTIYFDNTNLNFISPMVTRQMALSWTLASKVVSTFPIQALPLLPSLLIKKNRVMLGYLRMGTL